MYFVIRGYAVAGALALATLLTAPAAVANGRYPGTNQFVLSPTDSQLMVLRTTFGILFSHDGGTTWDWVCESAVGYGNSTQITEDPAIGVTQGGAVVAATLEGLAVSPDTGCSWSFANSDLPFSDVAVRPDNARSVLALSAPLDAVDSDAGNSPASLFESNDDGATWAPYGTALPLQVVPETVDVAATDPHRVYVAGKHLTLGIPQGALFASIDDGKTWTENVVPIDAYHELDVLIAAVDPTNPDRVYMRVLNSYGGRLIVTDDGGKTLRPTLLTMSVPMLGFALSADGSKVYVGGSDGVRMASATDLQFSMMSTTPVQCLAAAKGILYACSSEDGGGFVLGASSNDGASFTPILHLNGIRGPLQCGADASAAQCIDQWPAIRDLLDSADPLSSADAGDAGGMDATTSPEGAAPEASVPEAGAFEASDSGSGGSSKMQCGCTAAGLSGLATSGGLLVCGNAIGAFFVRRLVRHRRARGRRLD